VSPEAAAQRELQLWGSVTMDWVKSPRRSERPPKRRMVLRDYVRVEWRNFMYNSGQPGSSKPSNNAIDLRVKSLF
jgi:hypothetical protein